MQIYYDLKEQKIKAFGKTIPATCVVRSRIIEETISKALQT